MKGVLASYRWRRRLMWLTGTLVLVAGLTAIALVWPNTAPKEPGVSNVRVHVDNTPPKPVRLKIHDKAASLAVVSRFIDTAVARKDIDKSWDLVSPEFRAGMTRKQWDTGEMPVSPYPVGEARWKLEYSDVEGVGYSIALLPPNRSHQRAQVFLVGLHTLGLGTQRHWVIDNWQSAPASGALASGAVGNGSGGALQGVSPNLSAQFGKSRESAAWLLLPVGLLSLIVLLPLGIGSVNWYRARRARALLGR